MSMKPLTLGKIAEVTDGRYVGERRYRNSEITSVVRDSRDAEEGSLFVAFKGDRVDGHDFAVSAVRCGALACLVERDIPGADFPYIVVESTGEALCRLAEYYRTLFSIPVVGIVGSVGKTTAKEMVSDVLNQNFNVLKTPENLNNEIGVPLTLLSLEEDHEVAVIEMGISNFGEMDRLSQMVKPDICVMTTIGYCHLENLGDLYGVLSAKSEVFNHMSYDAVAIMNGDDELLRAYDPGIRKITYGLGSDNDFYAENVTNRGLTGISAVINFGSTCIPAVIPAYGTHIVMAALAAVAVAKTLGMSNADIAAGLADYRSIDGRANVIETRRVTLIDDCYNANPNSVSASLRSLSILKGKKTAILGDMKELGEDSLSLHRSIGALAAELKCDALWCLGDDAAAIYEGYTEAGGQNAVYFKSMDDLLEKLPDLLSGGGTVLVKASHSMHFDEIVNRIKTLDA